ncbi:MAG: hypothetical protein KJ990_14420 [Proteobacteria bacterium]|nr:hypothetical protein [Pseudomonadota bacterium]MBU1650541.1 hypothetical protein [Pseudomonadota bacterium]
MEGKKRRKINLFLLLTLSVSILAGCAGKFDYSPPPSIAPTNNSVMIEKNKDEVWKTIVPALGKNFFVINNLDKESGIINLSYSGDPEKYIDCGTINSYVKNARGERTYNFPASSAQQTYEVMDMKQSGGLFWIDRKMNLEGRMNLIIEEIEPSKCLITANTKYILTKSVNMRNVQGASKSSTDTISFNSGQGASFPGASFGGTVCNATGAFEKEVLSVLLGKN